MASRLLRYFGRHHWGLVAMFIAMGGTAYAAASLPANSVGTRQLRRHAVTLGKISPSAERALRTHAGSRGPVGPSDAYVASSANPRSNILELQLPRGNYIATASCLATNYQQTASSGLTFGFATLTLSSPGAAGLGSASASVSDQGQTITSGAPGIATTGTYGTATLSATASFALPSGGTLYDHCASLSTDSSMTETDFRIDAIRVGSLHAQ